MTTPGSNGPDQQPGGAPGWGQPPGGRPGGYSPQPPPPAGGFPPGQYPPQGSAPYPPQGAPYPPQAGAPYPPQGAPYPPQGGAWGVPPKSGRPKWLIPVIAGVVLVAAALALFLFFGNDTVDAEVGDCFDSASVDNSSGDVNVVDCDDSDAAARVIGIEDRKLTSSQYFADDTTCADFPGTESQLWVGPQDDDNAKGTIYCLDLLN